MAKTKRSAWYTNRERFYSGAPQASDTAGFQVYGVERQPNLTWKDALNGAWACQGEIGSDWAEMAEVAEYFNAEHDGCFYFVGSTDGSFTALLPSWREIRWAAHFLHDFPDLTASPEEVLGFQLTIGNWLTD